jgi:hypothetical protein
VRQGEVVITGGTISDGRNAPVSITLKYDLKPGGRALLISQLPLKCNYCTVAVAGIEGPGTKAQVVCRSGSAANVAIIGRSDPLMRRFVEKNPSLRLVDDPSTADAVVAIGEAAPADVPAVVIDPPSSPQGWSDGDVLENVALRDAGVLADDPVLRYVDFSGVAVRRATTWRAVDMPEQQRLVSLGDDALILAGANPLRIYVAFDTAVENTNFAMTESFAIFMTNVFKYLSPRSRAEVSWESVSPMQAGNRADWESLTSGSPAESPPQPGLYRDESVVIHAVSLVGLRSAKPDADPIVKISAVSLPDPQPMTQGVDLWPILVILAAGLWIAGWSARMR